MYGRLREVREACTLVIWDLRRILEGLEEAGVCSGMPVQHSQQVLPVCASLSPPSAAGGWVWTCGRLVYGGAAR